MCRLLAYKGTPIILDKLLYQPKNSLINQSFNARELEEPLNGDGFGIGWYSHEIDREPATFVSVYPAWNNRNLRNLSPKIKSECLMAHVRAASVGDVSESNCHPFQYKEILGMHNGGVEHFSKLKRRIREPLTNEMYNWIKGQTDSEHIMAYLLNYLYRNYNTINEESLTQSFEHTFGFLKQIMAENDIQETGYLNMVITNGKYIVGTRYVTDPQAEALTLYHSEGSKYVCEEGVCKMLDPEDQDQAVLIVSEKLTDVQKDWKEVPRNHFVIVEPNLKVKLKPILA